MNDEYRNSNDDTQHFNLNGHGYYHTPDGYGVQPENMPGPISAMPHDPWPELITVEEPWYDKAIRRAVMLGGAIVLWGLIFDAVFIMFLGAWWAH